MLVGRDPDDPAAGRLLTIDQVQPGRLAAPAPVPAAASNGSAKAT